MSGYYIALEGIDGSGKSTQAKLLARTFRTAYPEIEVFETREPGASSQGKLLRQIVIDPKGYAPNVRALALALDRALNIQENIIPALQRGALVISDRCYVSSIIYQSFGEGLDRERIFETIKLAIGSVEPDLIMWLDTPPDIALARLQGKTPDYFESKGLNYLRVLESNYAELTRFLPVMVRVPAADTQAATQAQLFEVAQRYLAREMLDHAR